MSLFNALDRFRDNILRAADISVWPPDNRGIVRMDKTALGYLKGSTPWHTEDAKAKRETESKVKVTFFSRFNGVTRFETSTVDKKIDTIKGK